MISRPPRCLPVRPVLLILLLLAFCCRPASSQTNGNPTQRLVFAGLRSINQAGQVNGVRMDAAGNTYLLLDQGDGVRLLKTDSAANQVLAQGTLGAKGDVGVALAMDPVGNLYVAGTTTSGTLSGTPGAAIPSRTDGSTNSFVAKFDANLKPMFVTFTGGSRIAATSISASADAVFVTGITYAPNLPVTNNGIQQAPAYGSVQNGFVEKFSSDGSTLLYATYITGGAGDTTPTSIAVDASDHAYLVGETSASGFPTIAALVPTMLSIPSGFLMKLTPAGDGITWSTYIPGNGLTSVALDPSGQTLIASGSVAVGQFPVDTISPPLLPLGYQVVLRIPIDGSNVLQSVAIVPGAQSSVSTDGNGGAWVDGVFSAPALPLTALSALGNGFAAHLNAASAVDQTARFGGLPNETPSFASLPITLTSIAVDPSGQVVVAGSVQPTASAASLRAQTYDLPLHGGPTPALPSSLRDAVALGSTCTGSLCSGSAAYLAKLDPGTPGTALSFSSGELPLVVLRNLGSGQVDSLHISATGAVVSTNCASTLAAGGECSILLTGSGQATLTASAANASTETLSVAALPVSLGVTIAFTPKELDFGLQTFASPTATRTITVTNLGTTTQTFKSGLDVSSNPKQTVTSPFTEVASDCSLAATPGYKALAPGSTCRITIGFTAGQAASSDAELTSNWSIGTRDVLLTGFSQAAALSVSASELDFGTQFTNGLRLPRYLYLANGSSASIPHAPLVLPAGSPFTLIDGCSRILEPATVCRVRVDYLSATSPSVDSTVLVLDQGLSTLLRGKTLPPQTVGATTVNPNLSVTPAFATFANSVAVTGYSSETQIITVSNSGSSAFPLGLALSGDFVDSTSCGTTLGAGQSCTVVVGFTPSQPGAREGLLAVTTGPGTSAAYVSLSGSGTAILPPNNGMFDLGSVPVGQPVVQFYKVSQAFTSLTATATGPFLVTLVEDVGFGPGHPPVSAYAANVTGPCRNCYLGIRFLGIVPGPQSGTVTLSSVKQGLPYGIGLTAVGLAQSGLVMTPLVQDYGPIPVNSGSGTQLFTVTNLLSTATAIPFDSPSLSGPFLFDLAASGGQSCGGSLAYGASCVVGVAFAPKSTGLGPGTLTVTGGGATITAALSGVGTADRGVAISPLALTFNSVPGSTATSQTVTITNTGAQAIQVGSPTTASANFVASSLCGILTAGASCTIGVTFVPGQAPVTDTLTFPVTTASAAPVPLNYSVALSGTYTTSTAGLEIFPHLLQFGPSPVGQAGQQRVVTVQNLTSKQASLAVTIPREFAVLGAPCSALAPNGSCSFTVQFDPLTADDLAGTLVARATPNDGSAGLTGLGFVAGYGTGTGVLGVSGGLLVNGVYNFGQVTSGQALAHTFTLINQNPAGSLTVRRVSSLPPFLSTTTCGSTLVPGSSCTVTVTYSPVHEVVTGTSATVVTDSGMLLIESDAASGPDIVSLTGQGAPLFVTNPSNSSPLAAFTLSQQSLSFPQVRVGDVSDSQTVQLLNTGTVSLHVTAVGASQDFAVQNGCATVVAGASCSLSVQAAPHSPGVKLASLEIASDAAVSLDFISLSVAVAPPILTLLPQALDFGPVQVGSTSGLPVQVTNTGSTPVIFASIGASGDYATSGTCPAPGASLAPGTSCTVQVSFTPTTSGVRSGVLSIASSASANPSTVSLTGTGTQSALQLSPSSLAFGNIVLGSSANLSLTVTNTGTALATAVTFSVTGDYAITIPCSVPSLAPGASCTLQLTFTPTSLGVRPGTLTLTSSDPGSPAVVPLTGTGIAAGGFTLTVGNGATDSATVRSGQPATYNLSITPTGGFSGSVALTCAPIVPAQFASCSIAPSTILLAGSPQSSVVTINTVTSILSTARLDAPTGSSPPNLRNIFFCLLAPGLLTLWRGRGELRRRRPLLLAMLFVSATFFLVGCGGGGNDINLRYSPPGTYQYQVTASSTSGVAIVHTVTLNLAITSR
jgi:hypothetical protein